MLRSFGQSAKSLVEESYLMLTEEHIIEIKCNKFSVANATVSFVIPVSYLSKLKFRRAESLSLFFKQSPDDPVIYVCQSSADAVKQLQNILKRYGVKGKHTNAAMQRNIQFALAMITEIKAKEKSLDVRPNRKVVEEIMDLYRQAAERFEIAGDERHEEVMAYLHVFLARPLVSKILDGSQAEQDKATNSAVNAANAVVPEGEILDSLDVSKDEMEDEARNVKAAEDSDDFNKALQAAEDMLKDAHDDLKDLGLDDLEVEEEEGDSDLLAYAQGC